MTKRDFGLFQQGIQLVDQFAEPSECRVHGLRGCHIHARSAKQIEWVFRATAVQEAQVRIQFRLSTVGDSLGQRDRGRKPGRVLVDVERTVEVRDAESLA